MGLAPCEDCAHAVMELIVSRHELFRPLIRTSQAWRPAEAAACSELDTEPLALPLSFKYNVAV